MAFIYTVVIVLVAAVLAVPAAKRLGFGSVLGYLGAGLAIGPSGLALVRDVEDIAQISELGVLMLLFLIGLELRPARLWVMRQSVLGLGAAQVAFTTVILAAVAYWAGFGWPAFLVLGFSLSLSSTAMVLPMLAERQLLASRAGRDSFAVLLFQDMAVIPAVALIPLLAGSPAGVTPEQIGLAVLRAGAALAVVLVGGRFLIRPIFRIVDRAGAREIFTATALIIVAGTAALVQEAGLSMSLGAFMAGVLLSDSEYRHELRADIEPFEGLLIGVFFISVGMGADLALLVTAPLQVLTAVAALLLLKAAVGFGLAKTFGQSTGDAIRFSAAMPQAGEFGFVLFSVAVMNGIMTDGESQLGTLVIALSMMISPFLFNLQERYIAPLLSRPPQLPFDSMDGLHNDIIICGFGRVGQVIGRVLRLRKIPFTALDNSAEQVDLVRRFGMRAYYGDAARLDVLRAAGAEGARILVLALGDVEASLKLTDLVRRHFPHLTIVARARNRRHAHLLMDRGVSHIVRDTFYSSLRMGEHVLAALDVNAEEARRTTSMFEEHDEALLSDQHAYYQDEKQMIQTSRQILTELEGLLEADRKRD